jgi:hypothetical protein
MRALLEYTTKRDIDLDHEIMAEWADVDREWMAQFYEPPGEPKSPASRFIFGLRRGPMISEIARMHSLDLGEATEICVVERENCADTIHFRAGYQPRIIDLQP